MKWKIEKNLEEKIKITNNSSYQLNIKDVLGFRNYIRLMLFLREEIMKSNYSESLLISAKKLKSILNLDEIHNCDFGIHNFGNFDRKTGTIWMYYREIHTMDVIRSAIINIKPII